jgi:hypothetical protein
MSPRISRLARAARTEFDTAIEELLRALTPVLVEQSQTPHSVFEKLKKTFVHVVAQDSRMKTGRINHSQVAAQTGLTRTEVRRLLVSPSESDRKTNIGMDRGLRVVAGWRTDHRFQNARGLPRPLMLTGVPHSFADLVRLHSGDIPFRAVLAQLVSKGIAKRRGDSVVLCARPAKAGRLKPNAFSDGLPYATGILRTVAKPDAELAYAHRIELSIPSAFQEALITRRVVRDLSSTAAALEAMSRTSKDKDSSRTLKVTLVLTSEPKSAIHRRDSDVTRSIRTERKRRNNDKDQARDAIKPERLGNRRIR